MGITAVWDGSAWRPTSIDFADAPPSGPGLEGQLVAFRAEGGGTALSLYANGAWHEVSAGGGVQLVDHGSLLGLGGDDHPHYLNQARGDARYYTRALVDAGLALRMQWRGEHTTIGRQYAANDVTRDGSWLMVAVADTTDAPAPQPTGERLNLLLPWSPVRSSARAAVTVRNRWTMAEQGWVGSVSASIEPENIGFPHSASLWIDGVQVWTTAFLPHAAGSQSLAISPLVVQAGQVVELRLTIDQLSVGNDTVYWSYEVGRFASPPAGTSLAEGSRDAGAWSGTAYGLSLDFQPGEKSPDWEVMAYLGGSGGGSGGGGGVHDHDGDYDPLGSADAAVAAHEGRADPHPQYATDTDLAEGLAGRAPAVHDHDGDYDPAGSAADAVAAHEAAADPHDQYLTEPEGDARYSPTAHNHDSRYFTETESDARFAPKAHDHDFAAGDHAHDGEYLPLSGGTLTGPLDMGGNKVANLPIQTNPLDPPDAQDAVTRAYVDGVGGKGAHGSLGGLELDQHLQYAPIHVVQAGDPAPTLHQRTGQIVVRVGEGPDPGLGFVQTIGGTMTGPLLLAGNPGNPLEAVTKEYVDSLAFGGGTADASYTHVQEAPAGVWIVRHNLGKVPSVSVIDGGGALVHGSVTYLDSNSLTVAFDVAISGTAVCN